ncbi:MAG: ParB/RepB/Spo0J family partition protein [Rhodospirillales bacterium]|nr:ParB/RepB/Spo0J family partition protein [Alphaproteobacteria bacterium]USO04108.1 MAG: ParB/RepB/Spo0J family partition protein [Rhodospirillales bacterium]
MTPKQRGLGRGLDALFEDEEESFSSPDSGMHVSGGQRGAAGKMIGIGQLVPNPDQPRHYFNDDTLDELASSIQEHGILQPILVRPHKHDAEKYEIIAGERRWRAAQLAQIHELPVVVRDLDDADTLQIALIENLQRQDLTPIEEAKGYQRLIDEFGNSKESVGEVVGKSRSHVSNMIRLLQLPESVQGMVGRGELSAGHARALVGSANPTLLAQEIISKGLSVRQAEKLAAEVAGREVRHRSTSGKSSKPSKDADTLALENEVSAVLGMRVSVDMKDGHAGKLSVEFKSLDQLDEVLQRLSHRNVSE